MYIVKLMTLWVTLVTVRSQRHFYQVQQSQQQQIIRRNSITRCFTCCSYIPQSVQIQRPNDRGCTFQGQCVQSGRELTSGCFTYRCVRRQFSTFTHNSMELVTGGCSRDNQCYPVGHELTTGCHTLRCRVRDNMFGFEPLTEACSFQGQCVPVDDTYIDGCFRYRCTKSQSGDMSYFTMELITEACSYKGRCVAVGEVYQDGCFTYQCCRADTGGLTYYSMEIVNGGCSHQGSCVAAGSTVEENCCTMRCDQENVLGTFVFTLRPVTVLCRDAYHQCHDPGTRFIYNMNGMLTRNCTCAVSGIDINYTCPPPMMMGNGD